MKLDRSDSSTAIDTPNKDEVSRKMGIIRTDSSKTIDTSTTGETSVSMDISTTGEMEPKSKVVTDEIDSQIIGKEGETADECLHGRPKNQYLSNDKSGEMSYKFKEYAESSIENSSKSNLSVLNKSLKRPRRVKTNSSANWVESNFLSYNKIGSNLGHEKAVYQTSMKHNSLQVNGDINGEGGEAWNAKSTDKDKRKDHRNDKKDDELFPKEDFSKSRCEQFLHEFLTDYNSKSRDEESNDELFPKEDFSESSFELFHHDLSERQEKDVHRKPAKRNSFRHQNKEINRRGDEESNRKHTGENKPKEDAFNKARNDRSDDELFPKEGFSESRFEQFLHEFLDDHEEAFHRTTLNRSLSHQNKHINVGEDEAVDPRHLGKGKPIGDSFDKPRNYKSDERCYRHPGDILNDYSRSRGSGYFITGRGDEVYNPKHRGENKPKEDDFNKARNDKSDDEIFPKEDFTESRFEQFLHDVFEDRERVVHRVPSFNESSDIDIGGDKPFENSYDKLRKDESNDAKSDDEIFPKENFSESRFEQFLVEFFEEFIESSSDQKQDSNIHVDACRVLGCDDFSDGNELFPEEDFAESIDLFSVNAAFETLSFSIDSSRGHGGGCKPGDSEIEQSSKLNELRKKREKLRHLRTVLVVGDFVSSSEGEGSTLKKEEGEASKLEALKQKREKLRQLKRKIETNFSSQREMKQNDKSCEDERACCLETLDIVKGRNNSLCKHETRVNEGDSCSRTTDSSEKSNSSSSESERRIKIGSKMKFWKAMPGARQQQGRRHGRQPYGKV